MKKIVLTLLFLLIANITKNDNTIKLNYINSIKSIELNYNINISSTTMYNTPQLWFWK